MPIYPLCAVMARREREGITLPDGTWKRLAAAAGSLGVALPQEHRQVCRHPGKALVAAKRRGAQRAPGFVQHQRGAALGSQPLAPVQGRPGKRRACVRNPDGVYVELMEDDPLPQQNLRGRLDCPVALRSVTLSTPDLDQSVAYLSALCSKAPVGNFLHGPEHEALWELVHAKTRSVLFEAGDVLLEVVQYQDPIGRPRPQDYRISDQGILNIAFGGRSKQQMMAAYERAVARYNNSLGILP